MKHTLTIVYSTGRHEPHLEWFLHSLQNQCAGTIGDGIKVVVVDLHADTRAFTRGLGMPFLHVPPKPTIWQGAHRVTRTLKMSSIDPMHTCWT